MQPNCRDSFDQLWRGLIEDSQETNWSAAYYERKEKKKRRGPLKRAMDRGRETIEDRATAWPGQIKSSLSFSSSSGRQPCVYVWIYPCTRYVGRRGSNRTMSEHVTKFKSGGAIVMRAASVSSDACLPKSASGARATGFDSIAAPLKRCVTRTIDISCHPSSLFQDRSVRRISTTLPIERLGLKD